MAKKVITKIWLDILAPKTFDSKVLGTVQVIDPETLINRTIEADAIALTGESSKYYMNFKFKIDKIEGNKAKTRLFKHECAKDFIARMVQLRTSKIDTNNIFEFKDGKIRIKTITISNRRTTENLRKKIRKHVTELLKRKSEGMTIDEFIKEMLKGKMQNQIKSNTNKIYPIRRFEIIKTHVL